MRPGLRTLEPVAVGRGRTGRVRALVSALLLAVAAACGDSGPGEPGAFLARATLDQTPPLGAAVLEVHGRGITGFSARGDTRLYSAPVDGRADLHRVMIVDPAGGEIGFDIEVDDVNLDLPAITVVQAADSDNRIVSAGLVSVRVER